MISYKNGATILALSYSLCKELLVDANFVSPLVTDEDKCHPNPCLHGGVCVSSGGSAYQCHCPSGFMGSMCEVEGNGIGVRELGEFELH